MRSAFLYLLIISAIVIAAAGVRAQPDDTAKRVAALAAFNEGIRFREQRTFAAYKKALAEFAKSAKLYEEIGDRANYASSMLGVGLIRSLIGERSEALAIYLNVLEIFRSIGHVGLQARTLNNISLVYAETGEPKKAVEFHLMALEFRRLGNDRGGEAQTLNGLGSAYFALGESKLALDAFETAIAIRRKEGDARSVAMILNNVGLVYESLGDRRRARSSLNEALDLRVRNGDRNGEATTLNNLGMILADEDPKAAIGIFERSLKIFTELGFEAPKATIRNNIGNAYLALGDRSRALESFRSALAVHTAAADRNGIATALNNIGFVALGSGTPQFAELYRSLQLARETQDRALEAVVLSNLMRAHHAAGAVPAAILFGKQCVNRYQELRSAIRELDRAAQKTYLSSIADQYRFLAEILAANGKFADAENVLRMLKEEEFSGFVRRNADEIGSVAQRAGLTSRERSLLERYAKLADRISLLGERFQKLDDKKRLLAGQNGSLAADEESEYQRLSEELTNAGAAFRIFLEKELVTEIGREKVREIQADRSLQARLRTFGNGTVAVSTIVSDERYRVIVTTPTVQVAAKTDIKSSDLNKKIFAFRKLLQDRRSDPRPAAKELYDILVRPIEQVLRDSGARTLVWSLDGTLRYVPIAALSPDGRSYLVELFENVVITAQTRDDIGERNSELRALGMGVSTEHSVVYPDYPGEPVKLESLPAVEEELRSLIRDTETREETGILDGRRFLNESFTLGNLTSSLARQMPDGRKAFNVVHFASHFRLAGNWSNSFLLIGSGEILTLEQLGNSPLLDFSNVELVTLSACNTAASDDGTGAEVESFASLIQLRNGKSVLATLWEVEDKSTAELMSALYGYLREHPKSTKAEAMRFAQRRLIAGVGRSDSFAHPNFWAPFVLIGNWR